MTKKLKRWAVAALVASVLLLVIFGITVIWILPWWGNKQLTRYENNHTQLIRRLGELAARLMPSDGTVPIHIENIIPEWKTKYPNLIDGDIVALRIYSLKPHPWYEYEVIGTYYGGSYWFSSPSLNGRLFAPGKVNVDGRIYHVNEYGISDYIDGQQFQYVIDVRKD